jgi:hypothetical protein
MYQHVISSDAKIFDQLRHYDVLSAPIGPYLLSSYVTQYSLNSDAPMKIEITSAIKTLLCLMRKYKEGRYLTALFTVNELDVPRTNKQ